jgi:L-threonylcarbamoyladenylate synthase
MKTEILPADHPETMSRALQVLQAGGLVAMPTDTVYGLGALAFDSTAAGNIYAVKGRPAEKAIPVLLGVVEDLVTVALDVPEIAAKLAARFWPGPLTLVVPKHPDIPEIVSALPTIGVRIPDHAAARTLLRLAGPMAVTSANLSGQASPSTAREVEAQLGGKVAVIIDAGRTPGGVPSTVVDCVGAEAKVLRAGPISERDILTVLGQ